MAKVLRPKSTEARAAAAAAAAVDVDDKDGDAVDCGVSGGGGVSAGGAPVDGRRTKGLDRHRSG